MSPYGVALHRKKYNAQRVTCVIVSRAVYNPKVLSVIILVPVMVGS
jgi:hypothetical protein